MNTYVNDSIVITRNNAINIVNEIINNDSERSRYRDIYIENILETVDIREEDKSYVAKVDDLNLDFLEIDENIQDMVQVKPENIYIDSYNINISFSIRSSIYIYALYAKYLENEKEYRAENKASTKYEEITMNNAFAA